MKKTLIMVIALVLIFSLAACGQAAEPVESASPTPTAEPVPEPTATPEPTPKNTLAIDEIAEGTYIGTLSGDSYTTAGEDDSYTISPDISPAELYIAISDGRVTLYCAASVSSGGAVFGVEAPRSPSYTHTVYGSLPLEALDENTVGAEGELTSPSETIWIYWDGNRAFTNWEVVQTQNSSYRCSVSIALADGVPTAEVAVDGTDTHRTATVPLTKERQSETPLTLWSNAGAGEAQQGARDYYVMFPLPDCLVTELVTDHRLSGGKEPGQLILFSEDGSEYGPFDAVGREGPDGTANAYWAAAVSIDLPAGRYAVADSDEATWSCSDETDGWGMTTVRGMLK